mmetsp:Transcript_34450/g.51401  ORF Transcript_34450/g.51401 Transcript_34450/m.51401 type:complete len:93 (+) Transcript_34450:1518-1796(+)
MENKTDLISSVRRLRRALRLKSGGKVNTMITSLDDLSSLSSLDSKVKEAPPSPPPTADNNPQSSVHASSTLIPSSAASLPGRMVKLGEFSMI